MNTRKRERIERSFETIEEAVARKEKTTSTTVLKNHTGNLENYNFDKEKLNNTIEQLKTSGEELNWSKLARDCDLSKNGKYPKNGGQVIQSWVTAENFDMSIKYKTKVIVWICT